MESIFPILSYSSVESRGVTISIESASLWWEIGVFKLMSSKPSTVCSLPHFLGSRQGAWEMEKTW